MAKIVFLELEGWEEPIIRRELSGHDLVLLKEKLAPEIISRISDAEILSIFIYSRITRDVLEQLPRLKAIVTRSTGYDHIDLDACRERGVEVYNIPDYGSNTVAEFTFLLIMALLRRLKEIQESKWFDPVKLRGHELQGKTIGVVGTGRIGSYVVKLAHAFGMKILAYDIYPRKELVEKYGVKYVDLETLLKNSDIITLHLPLTKETYHLINRNNIHLIKRGAILVNTARGPLVETEALVEALDKGILAGAALDVIEGERVLREEMDIIYGRKEYSLEELKKGLEAHILMKYPNVIITPHIAYNTWEAVHRILDKTINTIKQVLEGKQPSNKVA
ncbi:hypothetical protein J4526_08570 [Desulfurococcaceae archaeon MEX13E-LK6-19]|nr:hypothetical protein J4526_08570 [Desulfurococcaceae archaeon MEX13E-LK6-19]